MKVTKACLIILFVLMAFSVVLSAEEESVEELGTIEDLQVFLNLETSTYDLLNFVRRVGRIEGVGQTSYFSIMNINGEIAYCIEPEIYAGTGRDYFVNWSVLSEELKQKLFRITNVGYLNYGHDSDDWFVATQLAIWRALGMYQYSALTMNNQPWDVSSQVAEIEWMAENFGSEASFNHQTLHMDLNVPMTIIDTHGVLSHFTVSSVKGVDIVQNGNQLTLTIQSKDHEKSISGTQGLTTGGLVYTFPGKQTVYMVHRSTEPLSYHLNLSLNTGGLKLIKKNEFDELAEGVHRFELIDENGNSFEYNDSQTLEVKDGILEITDGIPAGKYILKEISTSYPYVLNEEEIEIMIETDKVTEISFVNTYQKISLVIEKVGSDTNELLKGAVFSISSLDKIDTTSWKEVKQVTLEEGSVELNEFQYQDTLKVCEVSAPVGYELSKEPCQIVTLTSEENQTVLLKFVNDPKLSAIRIIKKDIKTQEILNGAEFVISVFNELGEWIEKDRVIVNGSIELEGFQYGENVQVCEVKAPVGYELSQTPCQSTVLSSEISEFVFENELQKRTIEIIKKDDSGQLLDNAEFILERKNEDSWIELMRKSSVSGKVVFENLDYGSEVRVCEVHAPVGYELSETPCQNLTLNTEEKTVQLVFINQLIDIPLTIIKKDTKTQEMLNGAEFVISVFNELGEWIEKDRVTVNGSIELEGFKYGEKVKVCEVKAPSGYELSENPCMETVVSSEPVEFVFENDLRVLTLRIMKKDSMSQMALNGAVFEITDLSNENQISSYVSTEEGIMIENVEYGTELQVCEVKAPVGYELSDTPCQQVKVTSDQDMMEIVFLNDLRKLSLEIIKKDAETQALLEGAEFVLNVLNSEGVWIEKMRGITESGKLRFSDLDYGEYVQVCEVKAPFGYQLSETQCQQLMMESDLDLIEIEFLNELRTMNLRIIKKDAETKELLNGVEFSIQVLKDEQWIEVDSGSTGRSVIHLGTEVSEGHKGVLETIGFDYGQKVRVCEVNPIEGYDLPENPCHLVEMKGEDDWVEVVIENHRRDIEVMLYKYESDHFENKLNDALFRIVRHSIQTQSETENYGLTGRLYHRVMDEYGNPVSVSVEIYRDEACTDLWMEAFTDEQGELILECDIEDVYVKTEGKEEVRHYHIEQGGMYLGMLKYGDVVELCEVVAPTGFELNPECESIEVKSDLPVLELYFDNQRILVYEEVPAMGLD